MGGHTRQSFERTKGEATLRGEGGLSLFVRRLLAKENPPELLGGKKKGASPLPELFYVEHGYGKRAWSFHGELPKKTCFDFPNPGGREPLTYWIAPIMLSLDDEKKKV